MSATRTFREWMSRPVTWMTLVIVILGSAMTVSASPWGMPAADRAAMWIAFAWAGIFFAQLIALGAWAALRDGRWVSRISPPAALLLVHIVATAAGERLNSMPSEGSSAVLSVTVFCTAYVLFLLLRKSGWRIGPPREGSSVFTLSQLLLATACFAAALGVWSWLATELREGLVSLTTLDGLLGVAGAILAVSIATLLFCLLVIPAIGVVMDGRKRYTIWLLGAVLLSASGLAAGTLLGWGTGLAPAMLPIVLVLVTMWLFNAYRLCGYHFLGHPAPERPRKRWFLAGVCLALAGIGLSTSALHDLRAENAFEKAWLRLGIFPMSTGESAISTVSFCRSNIGITRDGVEALKREPMLREINVECPATPEQIGMLLELKCVDALRLSGKNKGDPHLQILYHAEHLKRIEFYDTTVTIVEVKKLQAALPDCEVRMTNFAGKLIVGP